jgi:antitoxin component YwqK of YwqJK toxin-antitoxin module
MEIKLKNIIFAFGIACIAGSCKTTAILSSTDKNKVKMISGSEGYESLDTLYYAADPLIQKWKVLYNSKEAAAIGFKRRDTSIVINYWRDGKIKEVKKTIGSRIYEESYCKNGQLLQRGTLREINEKYYCNGKPKYVFNKQTGVAKYYAEDGFLLMEGKQDLVRRPDGVWIYYDIDKIDHYEVYKAGEIIFKGDSLPEVYKDIR